MQSSGANSLDQKSKGKALGADAASDSAGVSGRASAAQAINAWHYQRWPCPADGDAGSDHGEFALCFGGGFDAGRGARVLVLPALFDEANKLRRFTAELMRRLSLAGVDSFLPDLPGTNESRAALHPQSLEAWRRAARAAADHFGASHVLTIRAGALLAPEGLPGWRYAPTGERQMMRSMLRARTIAAREAGREESMEQLQHIGREQGVRLAGWDIGPALFAELENASAPEPGLLTDIAQSTIGGSGLWLRAEPSEDPEQTDALAGIVLVGLNEQGALEPASAAPRPAEAARTGDTAQSEAAASRSLFTFDCEGTILGASLDRGADCAQAETGLLYVSGGNEIRTGAFNGQAALASQIAAAGYPVLRFDRRGIGDSDGENAGFRGEDQDIAAAIAAFRAACPKLKRIVGFGNCDAASALMLAGGAGLDALILSNPWTIEDSPENSAGGDASDGNAPGSDAPQAGSAQSPASLRARYLSKLKNPSEVKRLLSGGVDLKKLAKGLGQAAKGSSPPTPLAEEIAAGLARFDGEVTILLAEADRTAQLFAAHWPSDDQRVQRCSGASHAYAEPESFAWLQQQIVAALKGADR